MCYLTYCTNQHALQFECCSKSLDFGPLCGSPSAICTPTSRDECCTPRTTTTGPRRSLTGHSRRAQEQSPLHMADLHLQCCLLRGSTDPSTEVPPQSSSSSNSSATKHNSSSNDDAVASITDAAGVATKALFSFASTLSKSVLEIAQTSMAHVSATGGSV